MDRYRLQLSTIGIALTIVCAGLAIGAVERYCDGDVAPLWVLPRVVGWSVVAAGLGMAGGELVAGRRGAWLGIPVGFLVGWNAAVLSATASMIWRMP